MLPFPLQALLLVFAGVALFRLLRVALPQERALRLVVTGGFLVRAIAGQILFWVSWARLPVARSLQAGDGLWFFALDAQYYFRIAAAAAARGWHGIAGINPKELAAKFTQMFAVLMWLLGNVASVGLLLNLFCYLGTVAIIVHWMRKEPATRKAGAIAIVALSFSPSLILWSLQPLKDSLFQFLFVAFVAACAAWQRAWMRPAPWSTRVVIAVLLAASLFALSIVRWYVGFACFAAALLFLLLTVVRTAERKRVAIAAAAVVALVLSRALVHGADPPLPPYLGAIFSPMTAGRAIANLPGKLGAQLQINRVGYTVTGGGTMIRVGERLEKLDDAIQGAKEPPPPKQALTDAPAAPPAPKPAAPPVAVLPSVAPPAPVVKTAETPAVAAPVDVSAPAPPPRRPPEPEVAAAVPVIAATATATVEPPVPAPQTIAAPAPKIAEASSPAPPVPAPAPAIVAPPAPAVETPPAIQESPITHVLSGVAAIVLPKSVGEWLGIFEIGGGRSLFWFADLATIVFDAILLLAAVTVVLRWRRLLRNPLAWLVLTITLLISGALIYSVTNFGTLFRLRELICLGLLLTPLAIMSGQRSEEAGERAT